MTRTKLWLTTNAGDDIPVSIEGELVRDDSQGCAHTYFEDIAIFLDMEDGRVELPESILGNSTASELLFAAERARQWAAHDEYMSKLEDRRAAE